MSTLRTNFWSRGFRLQDCSANKGAGTAPNYRQDDKLSAVQRAKATVTLLCQGSKRGQPLRSRDHSSYTDEGARHYVLRNSRSLPCLAGTGYWAPGHHHLYCRLLLAAPAYSGGPSFVGRASGFASVTGSVSAGSSFGAGEAQTRA